jgi:hypothetical protein
LANFKKQGVFQQNRDLSFGKLGLNSRQVLTQFWVCLHAPLEPGDRFADHRIIQVANQPGPVHQDAAAQRTTRATAPHRDLSRRAAPQIDSNSALWSAPTRLQFAPNWWRASEREAAFALADYRGPVVAHFRRSRGSPALRRLTTSRGPRRPCRADQIRAAPHPSRPSPGWRVLY